MKCSPPLPREPTDFGGSDLWNKWFLNLPINNIETERYLKQRRCVVTKRPNCIPSSRHVHSSLKMINQLPDEDAAAIAAAVRCRGCCCACVKVCVYLCLSSTLMELGPLSVHVRPSSNINELTAGVVNSTKQSHVTYTTVHLLPA